MRVLALTSLYPNPCQPHRATFNRRQLAALAEEHEVQVIAPIAWTSRWAARFKQEPGTKSSTRRRRISDGMVVHHPCYAFTPKILRGWYGHFFLNSVRRTFREVVHEFHPEVVLGCWAYPDGWAAVRLAREAGLPVAIKVHGSDLLTLQAHRGSAARERRTTAALASADAVITVSRHLRDRALALGADATRTNVVYNGIDTAMFHPAAREPARERLRLALDGPLILFVGNLVPVKGADVLIDALASLAQSSVRFQCVCIGDGSMKHSLQSRIETLGLGAHVRLLGPRPQSELPDWYRSADLVVLPSRSEGVPNVLLEAAACCTPYVASRVGGVPEIAPPEALVRPDDPAALAEGIRTFLKPATRPATTPPRRPVSWRESAREVAAVLQEICEHRRCTALAS